MNANEETPSQLSRSQDKLLPGPGFWLSRALVYAVLIIMVTMIVWCHFTRVEIVVKTRGRVTVEGDLVKISVPEQGFLTEVAVDVGDRVEKDSLILQLDVFKHRTDVEKLEAEMLALSTQQEGSFQAAGADRDALRSVREEIEILEQSLAILESQAKTFSDLAKEKVFSGLEAQQKERDVMEAKARMARLRAEIRQKENEAAQKERAAREAGARILALEVQAGQSDEYERRMTVTAPEAGVITQLAAKSPGSVLQPSDAAAMLAPSGRPLVAKLSIPNKQMRRLRPGMNVTMRFDALPHQDYGHVEGRLISIEPEVDKDGNFAAYVSLSRTMLMGRTGVESLRVGLDCDADIVIEIKSVLDIILRPFRELDQVKRMSE